MLRMNLLGELTVARAGKLNELDISKFRNLSVLLALFMHLINRLCYGSTYRVLPAHNVCGRNPATAEECDLSAARVPCCELQRRDPAREPAVEWSELC